MHTLINHIRFILTRIQSERGESHLVSVLGIAAAVGLGIVMVGSLLPTGYTLGGDSLISKVLCAASNSACAAPPASDVVDPSAADSAPDASTDDENVAAANIEIADASLDSISLSDAIDRFANGDLTLDRFTPVDSDGDGVVDAYAIDLDGNGEPDYLQAIDGTTLALVDTDGDGVNDSIAIDSNGDGAADQTLTDPNATPPLPIFLDMDQDGVLDEGKFASAYDCIRSGFCNREWARQQLTDFLQRDNLQFLDVDNDGVIDYFGIDINGNGEFDLFDRVDGSGGIRFRDGGFVDIDLDADGIFDFTRINSTDLDWDSEDDTTRFYFEPRDRAYQAFNRPFDRIATDGGLNFGEGGNDMAFLWRGREKFKSSDHDRGDRCAFDCDLTPQQVNDLIVTDEDFERIREIRNLFEYDSHVSSFDYNDEYAYYLSERSADSLRELGLGSFLTPVYRDRGGRSGGEELVGYELSDSAAPMLAQIAGLPEGVNFPIPSFNADNRDDGKYDEALFEGGLSVEAARAQFSEAIANAQIDTIDISEDVGPLKIIGKVVVGAVSTAICGACSIATVAAYDTVVNGGNIEDFGRNLLVSSIDTFVPGAGGTILSQVAGSYLEDGKLTLDEVGGALISGGIELGTPVLSDAVADVTGFDLDAATAITNGALNTAVTGDIESGLITTASGFAAIGADDLAGELGLSEDGAELVGAIADSGTTSLLNGESFEQFLQRTEPAVTTAFAGALEDSFTSPDPPATFTLDENGNPIFVNLPSFTGDAENPPLLVGTRGAPLAAAEQLPADRDVNIYVADNQYEVTEQGSLVLPRSVSAETINSLSDPNQISDRELRVLQQTLQAPEAIKGFAQSGEFQSDTDLLNYATDGELQPNTPAYQAGLDIVNAYTSSENSSFLENPFLNQQSGGAQTGQSTDASGETKELYSPSLAQLRDEFLAGNAQPIETEPVLQQPANTTGTNTLSGNTNLAQPASVTPPEQTAGQSDQLIDNSEQNPAFNSTALDQLQADLLNEDNQSTEPINTEQQTAENPSLLDSTLNSIQRGISGGWGFWQDVAVGTQQGVTSAVDQNFQLYDSTLDELRNLQDADRTACTNFGCDVATEIQNGVQNNIRGYVQIADGAQAYFTNPEFRAQANQFIVENPSVIPEFGENLIVGTTKQVLAEVADGDFAGAIGVIVGEGADPFDAYLSRNLSASAPNSAVSQWQVSSNGDGASAGQLDANVVEVQLPVEVNGNTYFVDSGLRTTYQTVGTDAGWPVDVPPTLAGENTTFTGITGADTNFPALTGTENNFPALTGDSIFNPNIRQLNPSTDTGLRNQEAKVHIGPFEFAVARNSDTTICVTVACSLMFKNTLTDPTGASNLTDFTGDLGFSFDPSKASITTPVHNNTFEWKVTDGVGQEYIKTWTIFDRNIETGELTGVAYTPLDSLNNPKLDITTASDVMDNLGKVTKNEWEPFRLFNGNPSQSVAVKGKWTWQVPEIPFVSPFIRNLPFWQRPNPNPSGASTNNGTPNLPVTDPSQLPPSDQ